MATNPMNEVIQHLGRTMLLRDGAGFTDGQLLEAYLSRRDEAALAGLVRRHGPMVWGVCRRVLRNYHDAEDAFQATFLVLVRKAASIASRELLANWLYGVAHQTALKARATAAKRCARERQVTEMPEPAMTEQDLWDDLQPRLDDELSCLPDKHRAVIVLCDLEGKTRKEAARQLGVPEGTVASRMATARRLLAKRLARHGLVVSGGALASAVFQQAASACVPPSVVSCTIKAAAVVAAGPAAATGAFSVKVAVLTEGVLKAMLLTKLKLASALVCVFVLLCGAGILVSHAQVEKSDTSPQQAKENDHKSKNSGEKGGKEDAQVNKPIETTVGKVVLAYRDNDARGDEEFLGKRLSVRGRMLRVERAVTGKAPHYLLTLYADSSEGRFGLVLLDKPPLAFVFPADSRKQLASLEGGQHVTIEGVCEGRTAEGGHDAITFTACKIVKAKE
jgi:RNA polymerase sigma factor (sigma-70 family)